MDRSGDMAEDRNVAATWPTSGAVLLAIREVFSAIKQAIPDTTARRRGDLGRLRLIASLFVFALTLVVRFAFAWRERLAATTLGIVAQAQRHLHHPPQSWAAP